MSDKETHFGFKKVPWEEKQRRVAGVFDSVADNYDLMNDAMSFGIHRLSAAIFVSYRPMRNVCRFLTNVSTASPSPSGCVM